MAFKHLYLVIVTIQAFKSNSQGLHISPSHNWFLLTKFFDPILHVASQRIYEKCLQNTAVASNRYMYITDYNECSLKQCSQYFIRVSVKW